MGEGRILVQATVTSISDDHILYPCCVQCYSKMLQDIHYKHNRWRCLKCGLSCGVEELEWRYRLRMTVADTNEYRQVAVFGRTLQPFFGTSANAFHKFLSYLQRTKCEVADTTLKQAIYHVFVGQPFLFGFASANQPKSDISVSSLSHVAGGKGSNPDLIAVQMISTNLSQMGTVSQQMSQLLNRHTADSFHRTPSEVTKYNNKSPLSVFVGKGSSNETRENLFNSFLEVSDNSNVNSLLSVLLSCENSLSNTVSVSSAFLNSADLTEDRTMMNKGSRIGPVSMSCQDDVVTDPITGKTVVQLGNEFTDADETMDEGSRVSHIMPCEDDINSDPAMDNTLGKYYTDADETMNEGSRVSHIMPCEDDVNSDPAMDNTLGKYYMDADETMNDSSLLLAVEEPSSCNSPEQVPVNIKYENTDIKQSLVSSVDRTVFGCRQDRSAESKDGEAPADEWEEMPYSEDLDEFLHKAATEKHGHGWLQKSSARHRKSLSGHSDFTFNTGESFRHDDDRELEPALCGVWKCDEVVGDSDQIPCFEDSRSQVSHVLEIVGDGCGQHQGSMSQRDTVTVSHPCGTDHTTTLNERNEHGISTIDKDVPRSVDNDRLLVSKGVVEKLAAGEYMKSCNNVSMPVDGRRVADNTMCGNVDTVCWEDMPESEDLEKFLLEAGGPHGPVTVQHSTAQTIADHHCRPQTIADHHCRPQTIANDHCRSQTIAVSTRREDPVEPKVCLEKFFEESYSGDDSVFFTGIPSPLGKRTINNDVNSNRINSFRTSHHVSSDTCVLGPLASVTPQHQGNSSKDTKAMSGEASQALSSNLQSQHSNCDSVNDQFSMGSMVTEKTDQTGTCSSVSKGHDASLNGSTELFDVSGVDLFECLSDEEEKCLMEEDPGTDLKDVSAVWDSMVETKDILCQNALSEGVVPIVKDVSAVWDSMVQTKQGVLLQDNPEASPRFQKQVKFAKRLSHMSSIQLIDIRMKLNFALPMDSQLTPVRSCLRSVPTPEVTKHERKCLKAKENQSPLKVISAVKFVQKQPTLSHPDTSVSTQNDTNTDLGPVHGGSDGDNMDDYCFQQSQDLFANSQPTDYVDWSSSSDSDTSPTAGSGCHQPPEKDGSINIYPSQSHNTVRHSDSCQPQRVIHVDGKSGKCHLGVFVCDGRSGGRHLPPTSRDYFNGKDNKYNHKNMSDCDNETAPCVFHGANESCSNTAKDEDTSQVLYDGSPLLFSQADQTPCQVSSTPIGHCSTEELGQGLTPDLFSP
ncbi:serine-rich adhesin for platelets-like [Haliotis cracherodii]|uniref:serine-rich adhesin for platelets-like n=1 Tax=Haliotis cracherodii TaxID=6455 RepID=UPI0039EACDA9